MVRNIFELLSVRQTSILSGASIIMVTVMLSKILGLLRDRLLAHIFPPDTVAIFFAAFRIPDLVFQLFIISALSVAFIPIFTEYLGKKGREEAFSLARSTLAISLAILSVSTVFIYIFVEPLTSFVVPGFTPLQRSSVEELTKLILLGQIILTVGSFFIGILQSFQRFIIPALA